MDFLKKSEKFQPFLLLAIITIVTTLVLWIPFLFRINEFWGVKLPNGGMATVVSNYDGPYYIVAAKSLYDPAYIEQNFSFPLDSIYYSAHYPLFPLLIRGFATVLGYPYAMMAVTLSTSILAVWMFYILLNEVGLKKHSLLLAIIFTVLPARWFIVRSIGSPEPLFLFTIMASVYFFIKEKWWFAGIFGAFAQMTKSPGILLFLAYIAAIAISQWPKLAHTDFMKWVKNLPWKAYPILLIPVTLLAVYVVYGIRYGNFFAYFNSGDNIHLLFPPFQVFNPSQSWVGTFWLEEIIWIYIFGGLGVIYLFKQKRVSMASFAMIFFLSILFVSHRDIARYSLPLVPFLFIAFNKLLTSKEFQWVILFILVPIYLYSIVFIANNTTPIGDWTPLL